jgi:hypothetical protein
MMAMIQFAMLATATILGAAAAVAFHWLLLRITFQLMQPAVARHPVVRNDVVRGTVELARAYAGRR